MLLFRLLLLLPIWVSYQSQALTKVEDVLYVYPKVSILEASESVMVKHIFRNMEKYAELKSIQNKVVTFSSDMMGQAKDLGWVDKKLLLTAVKQQYPQLNPYIVHGPQRIFVRWVGQYYDQKALLDKAKLAINNALPTLVRHVNIQYLGNMKNLLVAKKDRFELSLVNQSGVIPLRCGLRLTTYGVEKTRSRVLWFNVFFETPVKVLKDAVLAKMEYEKAVFVEQWLSNKDIKGAKLANMHKAMRFTASHAAGTLVTESMLEPIPAVDYGANIQVLAKFGAIVIRTKALAMETANIGDLVRVESLSSGEHYSARVIDYGLAEAVGF